MKDNQCPKCQSKEVYKAKDGIGTNECHYMKRGSLGRMYTEMESYLCMDCGYFENYITNKEHLSDAMKSKNWSKV